MATATRIYHINVEGVVYLVRAAAMRRPPWHTSRAALPRCAWPAKTLVAALAAGVAVENAREEATAEG